MKSCYASILLFAVITMTSCSKEELPTCTTGNVRFTCTSDNPYNIYIDDDFEQKINGHTFVEFELLEGKHELRAEQASGFLLFPTIKTTSISVFGCQESEWTFP